MRSVRGGTSIKIPNGWNAVASIHRVTKAGLCSCDKLIDGTVSMKQFYDMLRVVDFGDYIELKLLEMAQKRNNGCRR